MRQHKILTRTLLILSIINFALAAPVAMRGRPEVHLYANVTSNVTAASQKRGDSSGKEGSTNVPEPDHAPSPSLDLTDILSQTAYVDSPPPTPDSPGSLTGSDYVLPSPELPTGLRLPVGSIPMTGSPSLPRPPPESGSMNVPGPDYAPPPSPDWTNVLSQIPYPDSTPSTPTPDNVPYHTPSSTDFTDILSQDTARRCTPAHTGYPYVEPRIANRVAIASGRLC